LYVSVKYAEINVRTNVPPQRVSGDTAVIYIKLSMRQQRSKGSSQSEGKARRKQMHQ